VQWHTPLTASSLQLTSTPAARHRRTSSRFPRLACASSACSACAAVMQLHSELCLHAAVTRSHLHLCQPRCSQSCDRHSSILRPPVCSAYAGPSQSQPQPQTQPKGTGARQAPSAASTAAGVPFTILALGARCIAGRDCAPASVFSWAACGERQGVSVAVSLPAPLMTLRGCEAAAPGLTTVISRSRSWRPAREGC
jgi:hypothetical protein